MVEHAKNRGDEREKDTQAQNQPLIGRASGEQCDAKTNDDGCADRKLQQTKTLGDMKGEVRPGLVARRIIFFGVHGAIYGGRDMIDAARHTTRRAARKPSHFRSLVVKEKSCAVALPARDRAQDRMLA
ncbi:MAG TPA: hypothetical protein VGH90_08650 [Chthoniobacteraceae bacterium]